MKTANFFILLLVISFYSKGQELVWKKQVSRVIDTRSVHLHKNSIGEIIIDAVRSGKVTVYDPIDNDFSKSMDYYAVRDEVYGRTDTMSLIDPVDGHEVIKIQSRPVNPDSIHMYRIMEEWTFNTVMGKINVQIKYIAPMLNVMGDDGAFRGRRLLFWIGFKDFSDALQKSNKAKKQERIFYNSLWQSYFEPFAQKRNNEQCEGYAKSLIDLKKPEDTIEHFLRDEWVDTSLSMQIAVQIENGKLPIWSGEGTAFSRQLTKAEFTELEIPTNDTTALTDPVDGYELITVSPKNIMRLVSDYYILQHWSLNTQTGKTEIEIKGIAPVLGNSYENGIRTLQTLFWVRCSDIQPILNKIEQYHPNNTFAMHIWDSYFLSDKKPVLVSN